jgi:hypothetical protein
LAGLSHQYQGLLGQINGLKRWLEEMAVLRSCGIYRLAAGKPLPSDWLVYPEPDLVYGNSDGLTVPAAEAAQAAGNTDILFTSVDGSDFALEAIQNGVLKSTFMYAPEYSGFWKAWVPFKAATGESLDPEILIKGALVNSDNVDCALNLAKDQKEKMGEFEFEKTLPELLDIYCK